MNNPKKISAILIAALLLVLVNVSNGQTKEEATNAYNRGVELAATDLPKAIEALIQAADFAAKTGADAADIQKMAEGQIPLLQYNYATSLYKEKKLDEAIANFLLAKEYATKYNDNSTKAKAEDLLPKLFLAKGNGELKEGKFPEAIASFDKAIEYDPSFAKAYLGKGLVYRKQDKFDEMKASLDKAIETGKTSNDEKTVASAGRTVADEYIKNANAAFKKGSFSQVVTFVDESVKYVDSNVEAYYLYALAFNKLSKWDEAINSAEKGLTLEENTPAKQARFHYEAGIAQAGKKDNTAACASFKKAAIGPLAEQANYQIKTVLKCN
ncbi:MAG: tetratricopeptide repeat protein [Bacteroidota bacterium]